MIISVTNRKLCVGDFRKRISDIAESGIFGVILREKDMTEYEYTALLILIREYFKKTKLIANSFIESAKEAGIRNIHLPYDIFKKRHSSLSYFELKGVSVHSLREAVFAEENGADYVIAGHIFPTACKEGLPARGTEYLKEIKSAVNIPVLGIGGINEHNFRDVMNISDGICIMSELMKCDDVREALKKYC